MLSEAIVVAVISGGMALAGTVISVQAGFSKAQQEQEIQNAVQSQKIEELTREVRKHNDFATRIPVLETRVDNLEKEVTR